MGKSRVLWVALATAVMLSLAGCTPGKPMPLPPISVSPSASASSTPTAAPVPKLHPGGTAAANQQFFDYLNGAFVAQYGMGNSQAAVNNLVANGFIKTDMEVTTDTTTLGIPADAIFVSVKFKDQCLIGQLSGAGYHGILMPVLSGTGKCLVGETLPIDW
jgi:hypothetical protein